MLPNNNFNTNIIADSINRITKIPMNIDISVIIVVIVYQVLFYMNKIEHN